MIGAHTFGSTIGAVAEDDERDARPLPMPRTRLPPAFPSGVDDTSSSKSALE
jgi:hypothetical protein